MNKVELVAAVAERTQLTKKDVDAVISSTMDTITDELKQGGKVALLGFGTFEVRERGERTGVNPSTSEKITIPASKAPAFKAGKSLKDAVNS